MNPKNYFGRVMLGFVPHPQPTIYPTYRVEHAKIGAGLGADIYFAHPYCSWERGTNENTNGLIRQYFPKGTDFNTVTDEDIDFVMDRLNDRPPASRGGKSPRELFLGQRVDLLAA